MSKLSLNNNTRAAAGDESGGGGEKIETREKAFYFAFCEASYNCVAAAPAQRRLQFVRDVRLPRHVLYSFNNSRRHVTIFRGTEVALPRLFFFQV